VKILVHMLDCFQTQPLLQFNLVSHRFQNLINRIVHSRLLRAASLEDRKLILECYHPSAQYTEPYLYCDYLGTPGLSEYHEGEGSICQSADGPGRSGTIRKLYSHFRPTRKDLEPCVVRSHPAGDIPGSRTSEAASSRRLTREADFVKQHISLEAHELFSQLCFNASLVQMGPRRGVFLSNVDVVDRKCMRIWRPWLAEMAKNTRVSGSGTGDDFLKAFDESLKDDEHGLDQTIWVDQNKMAGLRLRVKESKWRRDTPILVHQEEDDAVNYTLDLEGSHFVRRISFRCSNTKDEQK